MSKGKMSHTSNKDPLLNTIQEIDNNFKQAVREQRADALDQQQAQETQDTGCWAKFFSCWKQTTACFKRVSDSIPQDYKDVTRWLTELAAIQAATEYNKEVLVSALNASLEFISSDTTGSGIPAIALRGLIEKIAAEHQLDLKLQPNYAYLTAYCEDKGIKIPHAITDVTGITPTPLSQGA